MSKDTNQLIIKYKNKGVLIDTNLLLLFFIGSINPDFVNTFKRTRKYTKEDYDLIIKLMKYFKFIVTTPNVLTEVNSLSNSLKDKYKVKFYEIFSNTISKLNEFHMQSKEIVDKTEFRKFGLTDSIIYHVSNNKYLLLTDDFRLSQYIQSKNGDVINFNHIREFNMA